jgi:hypothetical protein
VDEQTIHLSYIYENWYYLAALAWTGHELQGRGAVWVTQEDLAGEEREGGYFPLADDHARSELFDQSVIEALNTYQPDIEIVVVFTIDNRLSTYTVRPPSPPEAASILNKMMDEDV